MLEILHTQKMYEYIYLMDKFIDAIYKLLIVNVGQSLHRWTIHMKQQRCGSSKERWEYPGQNMQNVKSKVFKEASTWELFSKKVAVSGGKTEWNFLSYRTRRKCGWYNFEMCPKGKGLNRSKEWRSSENLSWKLS